MAEGECLKVDGKEFCFQRGPPCTCSKKQDYTVHNSEKAGTWEKYLQLQGKKKKSPYLLKSVAKSAEHHHILCVGAIGTFVSLSEHSRRHAEGTTWCINDAANMILLPMWAMTLMHYCNLLSPDPSVRETRTTVPGGATLKSTTVDPPVFEDLPMHDPPDHGIYIKEVDADLAKAADDLALVKDCQDPKEGLKPRLEGIIDKYSTQLHENGTLCRGGTHASWNLGLNKPTSDWYMAFSMCRTPTPRVHPSAGWSDFSESVRSLHAAFWLHDSKPSQGV